MGGSPLKKRKKDGEQDVPATWTVGALGSAGAMQGHQ
jgi:hypothetical protein